MIVNIYLTIEQKKQLSYMSRKYEVSKSTIAEQVLFYLTKYLIREQKNDFIQEIDNKYLYEGGKKTSIKPKSNPTNDQNVGIYKNLTHSYTNALCIYLNRDLKMYLSKENIQRFHNDLNTKLQQTKELNWDYNSFIRNQKRYENRK